MTTAQTETSTTTSTSAFDKYLNPSLKKEALDFLMDDSFHNQSFGDILDGLAARPTGAHFLASIRSLSCADIVERATAVVSGEKKSKPAVEVPAIQNFKDPAVRTAWMSSVLSLLEKTQMGETRGLSPAMIRLTVGSGNEGQARELFAEMVAAKQVAEIGKTKGKKLVVFRLAAQAQAVYEKEVAEAAKKAEAAKVAKAEAEAKAAAEAKAGTPPAAGKGKGQKAA